MATFRIMLLSSDITCPGVLFGACVGPCETNGMAPERSDLPDDGVEDPSDVLRRFRESTRRGVTAHPRAQPVTLEEMTRRRDGWRQRWDKTDRELRAALVRNGLLAKQVESAKYRDARDAAEIGRLRGELAASQVEARRYAVECGRLRDKLAELEGRTGE